MPLVQTGKLQREIIHADDFSNLQGHRENCRAKAEYRPAELCQKLRVSQTMRNYDPEEAKKKTAYENRWVDPPVRH